MLKGEIINGRISLRDTIKELPQSLIGNLAGGQIINGILISRAGQAIDLRTPTPKPIGQLLPSSSSFNDGTTMIGAPNSPYLYFISRFFRK